MANQEQSNTPVVSKIEDANGDVKKINDDVLKAFTDDPKTTTSMGNVLADHASGLLMQNVTAFSQGVMQMAIAAIGKATEEIVATNATIGKDTIQCIEDSLKNLPNFISAMAGAAASMQSLKDNSTSSSGGKNG